MVHTKRSLPDLSRDKQHGLINLEEHACKMRVKWAACLMYWASNGKQKGPEETKNKFPTSDGTKASQSLHVVSRILSSL